QARDREGPGGGAGPAARQPVLLPAPARARRHSDARARAGPRRVRRPRPGVVMPDTVLVPAIFDWSTLRVERDGEPIAVPCLAVHAWVRGAGAAAPPRSHGGGVGGVGPAPPPLRRQIEKAPRQDHAARADDGPDVAAQAGRAQGLQRGAPRRPPPAPGVA